MQAVQVSGAVGGEASQHEGGAGAEVCGNQRSSGKLRNSANFRPISADPNVGTKPDQLGSMAEPFREHRVADTGFPWGTGEQCHELCLEIGGDPGVGLRGDVGWLEWSESLDDECIGEFGDVGSDVFQEFEEVGECLSGCVFECELTVGDECGDGEGTGFDAIGSDLVGGGVQRFDPVNFDGAGSAAADACSGGIEECGEVLDFGFAGGVEDDGVSCGECGGHHDVAGTGDGGSGGSGEVDGVTVESGAGGGDAAAADADVGSECRETAQVQVNRAVSDIAAAGECDAGGAEASEEWSEYADAGAHAADEFP